MNKPAKNLSPSGECWCGCGEDVGNRSFFRSGHDRKAESRLIKMKYGSVAHFLEAHGFGPGMRNVTHEWEGREGSGETGDDS